MMQDSPIKAAPKEQPATSRITVSRDQAMDLKVGLSVRLEVVGEIKEISRFANDNEKYDVVLEDPVVKNVTNTSETGDVQPKDLATMPKDDLRKMMISKSREE